MVSLMKFKISCVYPNDISQIGFNVQAHFNPTLATLQVDLLIGFYFKEPFDGRNQVHNAQSHHRIESYEKIVKFNNLEDQMRVKIKYQLCPELQIVLHQPSPLLQNEQHCEMHW